MKKIDCINCREALLLTSLNDTNEFGSYSLLTRKKWGTLNQASQDVIFVCITAEKYFDNVSKQTDFWHLKAEQLIQKITTSVLKKILLQPD